MWDTIAYQIQDYLQEYFSDIDICMRNDFRNNALRLLVPIPQQDLVYIVNYNKPYFPEQWFFTADEMIVSDVIMEEMRRTVILFRDAIILNTDKYIIHRVCFDWLQFTPRINEHAACDIVGIPVNYRYDSTSALFRRDHEKMVAYCTDKDVATRLKTQLYIWSAQEEGFKVCS